MTLVLIIEDDLQVRRLLKRALGRAGFETAEAVDGTDAIKNYSKINPDVTITDIIMPNKEGIETIIELRKKFAAKNIIAISGGGRTSQDSYLSMAMSLGADKTFSKPLDIQLLISAVRELAAS